MNITYIFGFLIARLGFFKTHIFKLNDGLIKDYDIININGEEIFLPYYNSKNYDLKKIK